MNYLRYAAILKNESEGESAYNDYFLNIEAKAQHFPEQLEPVICNSFKELRLLPFGSLNFKFKKDEYLHLQIPYSVELDNASIEEFLLFNLCLSSKANIKSTQYDKNNFESMDISIQSFQDRIVDPRNFHVTNLAWDYENNKIELHVNFIIKNNPIELTLVFEKQDIISAKLRIPNYSEEEYISLEQSGENDVVGYNRTAKIVNIFKNNFNNKCYQLI
jgi:hypothetical protein